MGTRINRYYNNPEIGAAISNLASIFEPPAPTDVLAYAQAAKVRREEQGLADLYGMAADPNADLGALDRLGAVTGQWNPTQGFGARDMSDATERYGIGVASGDRRYGVDVGAATARQNNAADNARALEEARIRANTDVVGGMLAPLGQGEIRAPINDDFMAAYGFPEMAVPGARGAPKPLSESEVEGKLLLDAVTEGLYTPEDVAAARRSDINVEEVLDPQGNPTIVTRADAVGRQPFVAEGSRPRAANGSALLADGREVPAVQGEDGRWRFAQNPDQVIPADARVYSMASPTGSREELGLTTGTQGEFQKRAFSLTGALSTIDHLANLVSTSPASQGLVGAIRGTAQDILQTGDELSRAFGGTMAEVQEAVAKGLVDANIASQMYDPNIPAIDMLMNVLAWQYAKSMSGDRVSNDMLRDARTTIGDGSTWGNQADSLTRLGQLRAMLKEEGSRLIPLLEAGSPLQSDLSARLGTASAAPGQFSNTGARPRAVNPQTGEAVEWDGQAWIPAR